MEFCKAFNAATGEMEKNAPVPTTITYYQDKSFTFKTKTPPASYLLKKAAGLKSGSKEPGKASAGIISRDKIKAIADVAHERMLRSGQGPAGGALIDGTYL